MINTEISVVMSVYKNDKSIFFNQAVESILNQSHLPSEIIIVIDGEIDINLERSVTLFSQNPIIRFIRLSKNLGLANALNIGIQSAKYSLIARMDSDDISFTDRFEKQIKIMNEHNLDVIGGQIIEFGKNIEDIISKRILPNTHADLMNIMKFKSPFNHPTIIFKKKVFNSINGYDTSIFPEDYDFFARAYLKGFKFGNVKDFVLWFRMGENYSEVLKRRWGIKYAINEFILTKKFYKIGFINEFEFLKILLFKILLRLIPFFIFRFIYFRLSR